MKGCTLTPKFLAVLLHIILSHELTENVMVYVKSSLTFTHPALLPPNGMSRMWKLGRYHSTREKKARGFLPRHWCTVQLTFCQELSSLPFTVLCYQAQEFKSWRLPCPLSMGNQTSDKMEVQHYVTFPWVFVLGIKSNLRATSQRMLFLKHFPQLRREWIHNTNSSAWSISTSSIKPCSA